jgi:hypothetical protein
MFGELQVACDHVVAVFTRVLSAATIVEVTVVKVSDLFAGALTSAVLNARGDDVQAAVIDDMVDRLDTEGDLDKQLERAGSTRSQAGDFGMEIAGAIVIPVLVEAAKALWAAYVKKLSEKAADDLANLSYKQVVKLAHWLWSTESEVSVAFEPLLRAAAAKRGLLPIQIEALLAAVHSPEMLAALEHCQVT